MKIQNLNFSYGDKIIFSNFNLDIKKGEITTILGKSGVGKTTLIKCLCGLNKSNITPFNASCVFQEDRLVPHLTVLENLQIIGYLDEQIKKGLLSVGLIDKINAYPKQLSGGEKQRVNILRAFLSDSEICLLDEPFSSLDISLKIDIIKTLISLMKTHNKTLLFITHDIEEALMLSNRIIVLNNNQIKYDAYLSGDIPRNYGEPNNFRQEIINQLF